MSVKGSLKRYLKKLSCYRTRYKEVSKDFSKEIPDVPESPLEKAHLWWKHDLYTKVDRYVIHSLWGVPIWRNHYKLSVSGTYGNPAVDIVELVGELFGNLDLPTLKGESAVFEGGCNIGRNLLALQKAYGCFVEGADISEQAIAIARNEVFGGSARSRFTSANLLDPDFFHSYSDNQFDLVITRAHLMHIPKSPAKLHYIEELKRIGKMFLMIEPEIQGRSGTEFHQHGAYALSWDDWENDYHMVRYQPNTKIPASYSVFYNKKTLPSLGS